MAEDQPLQVARCTKIIDKGSEDAKYIINVKQIAKFVVALADKVSPTDIEEGMRVGYVFSLSLVFNTHYLVWIKTNIKFRSRFVQKLIQLSHLCKSKKSQTLLMNKLVA